MDALSLGAAPWSKAMHIDSFAFGLFPNKNFPALFKRNARTSGDEAANEIKEEFD